jgi:hypothetical protein
MGEVSCPRYQTRSDVAIKVLPVEIARDPIDGRGSNGKRGLSPR